MTHPNNMTTWDTIQCQRDCDTHHTRWVDVNLARHGYADLTAFPPRFQHRFTMTVWDPSRHPVDGGPYCPAHDAVSETIMSHGVWEPRETVAMLLCLERFPGMMVDMGAQLGWFSVLAALAGHTVVAFEADEDNAATMRETLDVNNLTDAVDVRLGRIGSDTSTVDFDGPISFVKIDLEGAECDAVRMLWPAIEAGLVASMLIEVSPVFADYYPDMVAGIMEAGYDAFLMPPKRHPAVPIRRLSDLPPLAGSPAAVAMQVARWHQEDVLFVRREQ